MTQPPPPGKKLALTPMIGRQCTTSRIVDEMLSTCCSFEYFVELPHVDSIVHTLQHSPWQHMTYQRQLQRDFGPLLHALHAVSSVTYQIEIVAC